MGMARLGRLICCGLAGEPKPDAQGDSLVIFHRCRIAVAVLAMVALSVTACASSAPEGPAAPVTEQPTLAATELPSTAPTGVEEGGQTIIVPSDEPAADEPGFDVAEGIALADTDVDLVMGAYEGYGFTFGDLITQGDDTYYSADHATEDIRVILTVDGDELTRVKVHDYSGAEDGIDEMGFTLGIFAPEAQSWFVSELEDALSDPGTPMTAQMEFEYVSLTLNAYTDDDAQSLDLIFD